MFVRGTCLSLAIVAVSACTAQDATEDLASRNATLVLKDPWGCIGCDYRNSPTAGLDPIGSFAVGSSGSDLALRAIRLPDGTELTVELSNGSLQGSDGVATYERSALVGSDLVFEHPGGFAIEVRIYAYQAHADWVSGVDVDTYGLAHRVDGEDFNVCPGYNLDETAVVVMPDELYDDVKKTVRPQPGYATLACRGHAVAKMKMMGHAPNDGYGSSPEQRQATFKMVTADYCGKGHSFTQVGQLLDWTDGLGNFPAVAKPFVVEAKWNAMGATCLDQPRLASLDDVAKVCSLPSCGNDGDITGSDWVTFIP